MLYFELVTVLKVYEYVKQVGEGSPLSCLGNSASVEMTVLLNADPAMIRIMTWNMIESYTGS